MGYSEHRGRCAQSHLDDYALRVCKQGEAECHWRVAQQRVSNLFGPERFATLNSLPNDKPQLILRTGF